VLQRSIRCAADSTVESDKIVLPTNRLVVGPTPDSYLGIQLGSQVNPGTR